ncbi:MAG TPA: hypothetical protein VMS31_11955 [Pyrinomonadaceae bacterium]|nr:hypothetical protein [Pyrinomonadaceae bacterium]
MKTNQVLKVDHDSRRRQNPEYEPEGWRTEDTALAPDERQFRRRHRTQPDVRDQSLILELLGRINYKIIKGDRVYVEVGGVVYKTLYGGYWRSVFTGIEHYLLKCEEVSGSIWTDGSADAAVVDLPIAYSQEGWTASGHSLSFMLSRD